MRREWWEEELSYADMLSFFNALRIDGNIRRALCPIDGKKPTYTADLAAALLSALVKVPSVFAIFPIQDWLGLMIDEIHTVKPQDERINIPGTVSDSNWTYRLSFPIETLSKDKELIKRLRSITALRNPPKKNL